MQASPIIQVKVDQCKMYNLLAVIVVVLCGAHLTACQSISQQPQPLLSLECLGCICHATSQCNLTVGCHGEVCGPFDITKPYWEDTHKPTIKGQNAKDVDAFQNCANDLMCATETVQHYMQSYKQDCNFDGKVNCDDFVAIHYLGGGDDCRGELPNDYIMPFRQCKQHAGGEFSAGQLN